ncbi:MAG: hypothetical protein WDZ91_05865 [Paenibacillaceae bacterium]
MCGLKREKADKSTEPITRDITVIDTKVIDERNGKHTQLSYTE